MGLQAKLSVLRDKIAEMKIGYEGSRAVCQVCPLELIQIPMRTPLLRVRRLLCGADSIYRFKLMDQVHSQE